MNALIKIGILMLAIVLIGTLPACATYRKCGFSGCPGDAKITAVVRALLGRYPALGPPELVRVQTLDRVVYLTGQVSTDFERSTVESIVRSAPGVARVVSSIGVTYDGR
ncbi:MAG: BON domain-containing protein [Steroidobacteraceae bacterium]|jgi:osmotically-inducible protein OsmY